MHFSPLVVSFFSKFIKNNFKEFCCCMIFWMLRRRSHRGAWKLHLEIFHALQNGWALVLEHPQQLIINIQLAHTASPRIDECHAHERSIAPHEMWYGKAAGCRGSLSVFVCQRLCVNYTMHTYIASERVSVCVPGTSTQPSIHPSIYRRVHGGSQQHIRRRCRAPLPMQLMQIFG